MKRPLIASVLIVGFAMASWAAAMQRIQGVGYWIGQDAYVTLTTAKFAPQDMVLSVYSPTGSLAAVCDPGLKVVSWWEYTAGNKVTDLGLLQNGGGSLNWTFQPNGKSTVNAVVKFDHIKYALRYSTAYSGGSTPEGLSNVIYTNRITIADALSRRGYDFAAWTNVAAAAQTFAPGAQVTGADFALSNHDDTATVTLAADWTAHTYHMAYDLAQGQAGTSQPTTVTYDKWFLVADPTRTGYVFQEWRLDGQSVPSAQMRRHATEKTTEFINLTDEADGHLTLTAIWTPCTYIVTFNNHGASSGPGSQAVTYDAAYDAVNVPVRSGSDFLGYYTTDAADGLRYWSAQGQPERMSWDIPSNMTFHARWNTSRIYVEYDANGGEGTIPSHLVEYDAPVMLSDGKAFGRAGCNLLGWSESSSASEPQYATNSVQRFKKTTKLYAVWQMYYFAAFNANGGVGEMPIETFYYAEPRTLPPNRFEKAGYGFGGWATNATSAAALQAEYQDGELLLAPLTLVPGTTNELWAVWRTNTYFVAYDPGAGSGASMPVQTFIYDQAQALARCTYAPPKGLYAFDGWRVQGGASYADGAIVSNLTATAFKTNVLTAAWRIDAGDLSRHMHCDTLRWEMGNTERSIAWCLNDGPTYGCTNTGMSVSQPDDGLWNEKTWLRAIVQTNGVLEFSCRWKRGASTPFIRSLAIGLGTAQNPGEFHENVNFPKVKSDALGYDYVELPENGDWVSVRLEVPLSRSEDKTAVIHLANETGSGDGYIEIDQMRWTAAGEGVPVPGPENAPTVTGIAFENGKLKLTATSAAKFDYQVLASPSLATPIAWTPVEATRKAGGDASVLFELPTDPAEPRKFYKVEVLKKK